MCVCVCVSLFVCVCTCVQMTTVLTHMAQHMLQQQQQHSNAVQMWAPGSSGHDQLLQPGPNLSLQLIQQLQQNQQQTRMIYQNTPAPEAFLSAAHLDASNFGIRPDAIAAAAAAAAAGRAAAAAVLARYAQGQNQ